MKLIVGLGNPEAKYFKTRHNAGRRTVEALAASHSLRFSLQKSDHAWCASWESTQGPLLLAYPDEFMNVSGDSISRLVLSHQIRAEEDLLILVDEAALPFGRLRLRGQGSDGGHNGLKSIQAKLGTLNFARLRIGVGPQPDPESGKDAAQMIAVPLEDYVLDPFTKSEEASWPELAERAMRACLAWAEGPLSRAMNQVNAPQDSEF